jgi:hypothetical protein
VLPRRESRAERRRIDDLAFHLDDEFLGLGRQFAIDWERTRVRCWRSS